MELEAPLMAPDDRTSMLDLPTELLFDICQRIPGDIVQLTQDEPANTSNLFTDRVRGLASLVRTCKMLKPIAEEVLYQITVLGDITQVANDESPLYDTTRSPVISLIQTLIDRPELRNHLKVLQLMVPGQGASDWTVPRSLSLIRAAQIHTARRTLPLPLLNQLYEVVDRSPLAADIKRIWRTHLTSNIFQASCGILLMLTPQLQILSLATQSSQHTSNAFHDMFGVRLPYPCKYMPSVSADTIRLDRIPALARLKHLRMRGYMPPTGSSRLPGLASVDWYYEVGELRQLERSLMRTSQAFPQVLSLRLDCCFDGLYWVEALDSILESFTGLAHLALVSPRWRNRRGLPEIMRLDFCKVLGCVYARCPGLVALENPDGPWSGYGLSMKLEPLMRGFGGMERMALSESLVRKLRPGWTPSKLKYLRVADRKVGVDGEVEAGYAGLVGMEGVVVE
jgi:hypothetical protein